MNPRNAPTSLMFATLLGMAAPVAAATSPASIPIPDVGNPLVGWLLAMLAAGLTPPIAWLAWMLARFAGAMTASGIRALAGWIEYHVRRTPSPHDDAPGAAVAAELRKRADELEESAKRGGGGQ